MTPEQRAVLIPLVFFDCFDRPILKSHLRRIVYGQKLTDVKLQETLDSLREVIDEGEGFIRLKDRKGLIANAKLRRRYSIELWYKARKIGRQIASLPFIRLVAVINSLSFWNVRPSSDIDVLLIVEKGFLPAARDQVNLLLTLSRKRNNKPPKAGKVAVDIILGTDNMSIEGFRNKPRDIYLDFWANAVSPIYDLGDYYQQFLDNNGWIKNTFPNFEDRDFYLGELSSRRKKIQRKIEQLYFSPIGKKIFSITKKHQMNRLNKFKERVGNSGTVVVSDSLMRFNIPDRRKEYQQMFDRRWQQVAHKV